MQTENMTQSGPRPDLAVLPVNAPIGYVGGRILPVVKVAQKVGDAAYCALLADSAAQTNRALGAAPSATNIGEATIAVTCTEKVKRYTMDWTSVPLYGGVAKADQIGARAAKRSVMNAIETAQLAILVDGAGTSITSAIMDGIIDALDKVHRYDGRTAFVCSVGIYRWLIQQTEIKNLLVRSFQGLTPAQAMSLSPEVFKATMQGLLAVDEVLIADDKFWPYAYRTTAAVVKIPDGTDETSFAYQAEFGRTFVYWPDDGMFELSSHPDNNLRSNVYDAQSFTLAAEMNAGAKALVQLNTSGSTTTTTT